MATGFLLLMSGQVPMNVSVPRVRFLEKDLNLAGVTLSYRGVK